MKTLIKIMMVMSTTAHYLDTNSYDRADRRCSPVDASTSKLKMIYVDNYSEGMSSWLIAFSEMLAIANMTKATLVEPCVLHGALSGASCKENNSIPLRHVLNISRVMDMVPIIGYDEYVMNWTSETSKYSICMHFGKGSKKCGKSRSIYATKATCPSAIAKRAKLLFVTQWRRYGVFGLNSSNVNFFLHHLDFTDDHYLMARRIVNSLGFAFNSYTAFQWRSETVATTKDKLHYCANALIKIKEKFHEDDGNKINQSVILITDLVANREHQWGTIKEVEPAAIVSTLGLLDNNDFKRTQHSLNLFSTEIRNHQQHQVDLINIAIWEAIIAASARTFITCSDCKSKLCRQCAWQAHFPKMILDRRKTLKESQKIGSDSPTHSCWPTV